MTFEDQVQKFFDGYEYEAVRGPLASWRNIARTKRGDCEDVARTIAQLYAVTARPLEHDERALEIAMRKSEVKFYLTWSPTNQAKPWPERWVPRHTIVWIKNHGFVDSTRRKLRPFPDPHIIAWRWPNWFCRKMFD